MIEETFKKVPKPSTHSKTEKKPKVRFREPHPNELVDWYHSISFKNIKNLLVKERGWYSDKVSSMQVECDVIVSDKWVK